MGAAFGDPSLIEALVRVKDSFNSYPVDRLAEAGAVAAIGDEAWFETTRARIVESRTHLAAGLERLGFSVLPSAANFVFARHARHGGAALQSALREAGVLVRHFTSPASPTTCASPSAPTPNATSCWTPCFAAVLAAEAA